jgi:xylono-1,5-lactonase
VWDERRDRLYFVDCASQRLHWLDDGDLAGAGGVDLHDLRAPSMPAGIVPTTDGRLVVTLDDGLYVLDPDAGTSELLAPYPKGLGGGRCNDACADTAGNLVTGKLNLGPDEGSAWLFSTTSGWRLVDDDISNTNGPQVGEIDGETTLIIGDTSAHYYAYAYVPETGDVGERRIFGDMTGLPGGPDGTTLDAAGGLWCALFGGGRLVRFTAAGLDRSVPVPTDNPTDVTFGGPGLDRLYVVAVDGGLLAVDGLGGPAGRPEPRFSL